MMKAILGPPHIYAASTERRVRSLAKRLSCGVHTLQLGLERMAADMWPSSWKNAKEPCGMDRIRSRAS